MFILVVTLKSYETFANIYIHTNMPIKRILKLVVIGSPAKIRVLLK